MLRMLEDHLTPPVFHNGIKVRDDLVPPSVSERIHKILLFLSSECIFAMARHQTRIIFQCFGFALLQRFENVKS